MDWENYTKVVQDLRKEPGHIRFECRSLFNALIACFARFSWRVHAYEDTDAIFKGLKYRSFVHVSTNETYLNGLTMEQLRTDFACHPQCCNVWQMLCRYVGIYEIESCDTRLCMTIGSRLPFFHATGVVFRTSDNIVVSRLICYTIRGWYRSTNL